MQALGFVEIQGVVAAVTALDLMLKAAGVSLVTWERKLGGRLVTIIVTGDIAAVNAAMEVAQTRGIQKPCATLVLPRPHPETQRLVALSASRLTKTSKGVQEL